MKNEIKEHLIKYCKSNSWGYTDEDLREVLEYADVIWEGLRDSHRWYDLVDVVVEIDGMIIGFQKGLVTGDYQDNKPVIDFDTVYEAEAYQVTTVGYRPKQEISGLYSYIETERLDKEHMKSINYNKESNEQKRT